MKALVIAGDAAKIAAAICEITQQAEPPLRTTLGVDTYATLGDAYARRAIRLQAQEDLADSVAIEGKTGFMPI